LDKVIKVIGIILAAIAIPISAEIDGCDGVARDNEQQTQSIFEDKLSLETGDEKLRVLTKEEPEEIKTEQQHTKGGNSW
jgi:hypothetical protein